jgi:tellurite resistance protein TehA-like permease
VATSCFVRSSFNADSNFLSFHSDPTSVISLKYKKKTDEYSKDDFDFIRHMQISYFAMPLSLAALAISFKLASDWTNGISTVLGVEERDMIVHEGAFQAIASVAFLIFFLMFALYTLRFIMYPHKCVTDWQCPLRGNSFAMIPLCLMCFAFLFYDQIEYDQEASMAGDEEAPQIVARIFFWIGAVAQVLLTVAKLGEWIARRLELEHVHPHWIILPVGLSVAALVAPMIPLFAADSDHAEGTVFIARFFQSFAVFMFLVLFTITFFKVVTSHNSDTRLRHGIFTWLAAPAVLGMSDFSVCFYSKSPIDKNECVDSFANYYFISIFMFLGILYSAMPFIGFLGKDKWGMQYWIGCFALAALSAAACLFYAVTDFRVSQTLAIIGLVMGSVANMASLLHTGVALIRRRELFVPENKWGPLSFMKLTHEAFRGNMSTMRGVLANLDLTNDTEEMKQNLSMFAVHLNRFSILHEEHSKHEDEVIFKVFNDWFHEHAKQFNDDHEEFHVVMDDVEKNANIILDSSLPVAQRQQSLDVLNKILPPFFASFEEHLKGEEDNLQPIGKKYLPLAVQKEISRKVWEITSADRWEIIIPYVVLNLPRHMQRVRYLKVLLWSLPERAQQVGAIVYRNVDAVMWERLREDVPEMIPRGESGWWRYY